MVTYYHVNYNLCKLGYVNNDLDRFVINYFYDSINDD